MHSGLAIAHRGTDFLELLEQTGTSFDTMTERAAPLISSFTLKSLSF